MFTQTHLYNAHLTTHILIDGNTDGNGTKEDAAEELLVNEVTKVLNPYVSVDPSEILQAQLDKSLSRGTDSRKDDQDIDADTEGEENAEVSTGIDAVYYDVDDNGQQEEPAPEAEQKRYVCTVCAHECKGQGVFPTSIFGI